MEPEPLPDSEGQPQNAAENQILRPMAPVPDSWPGVDEAIAAAAQADVPQLRNLVWRAALLDSVAERLAWLHHYEEVLRDPDAIPGGTDVADLAVHQMLRRHLQLVLLDECLRGWAKAEGHDPDELARLGDATRPSSVRDLLDHPLLRVFCTRNAIARLRARGTDLRIAAPEHEYVLVLTTLRRFILARVGPIVPRYLADHDHRIARLAEAVIAREADHAPPLAPLVDPGGPRTPEVLLAAVDYLTLVQKRLAPVAAPVALGASGSGEPLRDWRQLSADFNALGQILAGSGVANPALVTRLRGLLAAAGRHYVRSIVDLKSRPIRDEQWWLARLCGIPSNERFDGFGIQNVNHGESSRSMSAAQVVDGMLQSQRAWESRDIPGIGRNAPVGDYIARHAFVEAIHELSARFPDRSLQLPRRQWYLNTRRRTKRHVASDYSPVLAKGDVETWLLQLIGAAAEACRVLDEQEGGELAHAAGVSRATPAESGHVVPRSPDALLSGWKEIKAAIKRHGLSINVTDAALREWAKCGKFPATIDPRGGRPKSWDGAIRKWCEEALRRKDRAVEQTMSWLEDGVADAPEVRHEGGTHGPDLGEGGSVSRRQPKDLTRNSDGLSLITRRGQARRSGSDSEQSSGG